MLLRQSTSWMPMDTARQSKIRNAFESLPDGCRCARASESEVGAFEPRFGSIPGDYRWFLIECGGGTVGSEWVDGISELSETHRKYRSESQSDDGWNLRGVFIIGWDGGGNPYGIESDTGKIVVEDHDFSGVHELAPSFEAFLVRGFLQT